MKTKHEIESIINHASSTEAYHRFSLIPNAPLITDGVLAVATAAGCFWLLDIIMSYQMDKRLDPSFQVWKLNVTLETSTAVVNGYNDTELIVTQDIPFTDFPLEYLKLYLIDGIILLPSEY